LLRSKDIQDFFSAEFTLLRKGSIIPFDICLYFSRNNHLILWRKRNTKITEYFLKRHRNAGANLIWIHQDDKEAYEEYLREKSSGAERKTEEGCFIADVMKSERLSETEKSAVVAEAAKEIVSELSSAETLEDQKEANEKAKKIIEDILHQTATEVQSAVQEIQALVDLDPDLSHGANVSIYAVLFSMSLGNTKPDTLHHLSTAGLLHDLGVYAINAEVTEKSWDQFNENDLRHYEQHPELAVEFIKNHFREAPADVCSLILQSHEKFDGSGYPKGTRGFELDDTGQLIAIAELFDTIASGQWDGKKRTFKEAVDVLTQLDAGSSSPEHFNPDIFHQVRCWIQVKKDGEELNSSEDAVKDNIKALLS
jgi:HD-GYP domain-containing protein (c-di-GMP phosphodiesterase class II)